jgi:signal transduction histidine kinase
VIETFRRRSLRRQLVACVTGVQVILMAAFVFDLVDRQRKFLLNAAQDRILHQAESLAAAAVVQLGTNDFAGLQEVLLTLSKDAAIPGASVTDAAGKILGHSDPRQIGLYRLDAKSREVLSSGSKPLIISFSDKAIHAAAPVKVGKKLLGWAWISEDLTALQAQIAAIRKTGIAYIAIASISGLILSLALAHAITRQLRLLLAGTKRMAVNDLSTPVPVTTDTEVGRVARAFNNAMEKLHTQQEQLIGAHRALEIEVEERRRAETDLQSANRAIMSANESLRQFAYAASHDLQEPLRALSGYSELLRRRYTGKLDANADDFIRYIHEGTQRMQHLLRALLDYSRAGSRPDAPTEIVDVTSAVDSALANLRAAIDASGAAITVERLPRVRAHEVAVVQLFQNLIGNAIKYSGLRPPEIRVHAQRDGTVWRFAVSDNGIGIAEDDRERVFGIFKRVGTEVPGMGIGLAICAKLVERYGGRIWVESEVGAGSTFWFTLPAVAEQIPVSERIAG